jgi:glutaredoxin
MRNWLSWFGWRRSAPQHDVVLYTRVGCHLCDDAKAMLQRYLPHCPIVEVDIDTDPELSKSRSSKSMDRFAFVDGSTKSCSVD